VAITEHSRHQLFKKLEQMLGEEEAAVLMEHLPPVGWADVATRRDLEQLELRLDARIDGAVDRALRSQSERFIVWMIGVNGLFFTAQGVLFGLLLR